MDPNASHLPMLQWRALSLSHPVDVHKMGAPHPNLAATELSATDAGDDLRMHMAVGRAWVATRHADGSKFLLHRLHHQLRPREAFGLAREVALLEAMQKYSPALLCVSGLVQPDATFNGVALLSEPIEATLEGLLNDDIPLSWSQALSLRRHGSLASPRLLALSVGSQSQSFASAQKPLAPVQVPMLPSTDDRCHQRLACTAYSRAGTRGLVSSQRGDHINMARQACGIS